MVCQLGCQPGDDAGDVGLHQVVVEAHVVTELLVRGASAIRHLDDESLRAGGFRAAQHEWNRVMARDQVRPHTHLQHP
jgi:hypothetical protein